MSLTDPKAFEERLRAAPIIAWRKELCEAMEAISILHATLIERQKRVVELEVALEPFKRWADQLDSSPNLVPDGCPLVTSPRDVSDFSVSHLRAARTALAHQSTYLADKIAEAKREGAAEAYEKVVTALWERCSREEYGHAKAAVTLDIEVVNDLKNEAEAARRAGEVSK